MDCINQIIQSTGVNLEVATIIFFFYEPSEIKVCEGLSPKLLSTYLAEVGLKHPNTFLFQLIKANRDDLITTLYRWYPEAEPEFMVVLEDQRREIGYLEDEAGDMYEDYGSEEPIFLWTLAQFKAQRKQICRVELNPIQYMLDHCTSNVLDMVFTQSGYAVDDILGQRRSQKLFRFQAAIESKSDQFSFFLYWSKADYQMLGDLWSEVFLALAKASTPEVYLELCDQLNTCGAEYSCDPEGLIFIALRHNTPEMVAFLQDRFKLPVEVMDRIRARVQRIKDLGIQFHRD